MIACGGGNFTKKNSLCTDEYRTSFRPCPSSAGTIRGTLRENAVIGGTSVIVSGLGLRNLCGSNAGSLLFPTGIHTSTTPLRAFSGGSHRFSADKQRYRICMRRRQDPKRDPTALMERQVEMNGMKLAVCFDLNPLSGHSIHNQFNRHLSRASEARTLKMPVRLIVR